MFQLDLVLVSIFRFCCGPFIGRPYMYTFPDLSVPDAFCKYLKTKKDVHSRLRDLSAELSKSLSQHSFSSMAFAIEISIR